MATKTARMTDGGLSLWAALALLRQVFVHAFLPSAEREALLKRVDSQIFALRTTLFINGIL